MCVSESSICGGFCFPRAFCSAFCPPHSPHPPAPTGGVWVGRKIWPSPSAKHWWPDPTQIVWRIPPALHPKIGVFVKIPRTIWLPTPSTKRWVWAISDTSRLKCNRKRYFGRVWVEVVGIRPYFLGRTLSIIFETYLSAEIIFPEIWLTQWCFKMSCTVEFEFECVPRFEFGDAHGQKSGTQYIPIKWKIFS